MDGIVTFHVVRERRGRQPLVMARMLTDRVRLRRVDGLVVSKVLGCGRGDDTGPTADLLRQAYLLVWRDEAAARAFLAGHPIARRWGTLHVEHELVLGLLTGHGTWSGRPILEALRPVDPVPAVGGTDADAVVVLTRARIRMRAWRAFRAASRRTAHVTPTGRRWAVGVGELPVGLLGTVSCWSSSDDLERWLAADRVHAEAAAQAREWFSESLFARFRPLRLR